MCILYRMPGLKREGRRFEISQLIDSVFNHSTFYRLIVMLVKILALRHSTSSGLKTRIVLILDATRVW